MGNGGRDPGTGSLRVGWSNTGAVLMRYWPIAVVAGGFVITTLIFIGQGPRFTSKDFEAERAALKEEILEKVDEKLLGYPPDWLREDMSEVKDSIQTIERDISEIKVGVAKNADLRRQVELLLRDGG